jgi:hypothetical protein
MSPTNRKPSDDDTPNRFLWDFEGHKLGLTWWGGYGIGANDWHGADVVLLFDDFHLPRHTVNALTQGLKGREGDTGAARQYGGHEQQG